MEFELRNLSRHLKNLKYRLQKNKYIPLITGISYAYLYISYIAIIYNFSYKIEIVAKPIGEFLLILYTLAYFIAYVAFNHIVIKKIIPRRILLIIEFILFITLCVLWWSDLKLENRYL